MGGMVKILLHEDEQRTLEEVAKEWGVGAKLLFKTYTKGIEAGFENDLVETAESLVEGW